MISEKARKARALNALKGGRPVARHTLEIAEAKKFAVAFVHARLTPLLEAMYKKALEGDVMAFKELMDRSWGKAVQGVEVSGAEGQPIVFMPLALMQKHSLVIEGEQVKPQQIETVKDVSSNNG